MTHRREIPHPAAWTAWLLVFVLAATALAGCGSDNGAHNGSAPIAGTPLPAADGTPAPSPYELLRFTMSDTRAAAYRPDGAQIAIGSGQRIWLYTGAFEPVRALDGHTQPVRHLAWSPDGTRLASAALDDTARIWSPEDGQTLVTLRGHTDWVYAVAWSPDGTRLVTASADGSLREWDTTTGDLLTVLGVTRVTAVTAQLADDGILQAISDAVYAETILKSLDNEPLTDLVAQLAAQDYQLTITFDDPVFVATLLKLSRDPFDLTFTTADDTLNADLAALTSQQHLDLATRLDDPDTLQLADDLETAQATLTTINARDDAAMLQTVRSLQRDEIVVVITSADGQTTTVPAGQDFVATLAGLEGDFTVSFGVENQAEIAAKLEDKDFLAALQQLDEASATVADINARDDATLIRLVRRLAPVDYTLAITTGDETLDAALVALDNTERIDLLKALQDSTLVSTLQQIDAAHDVVSDIPDWRLSDITAALGEQPYTLAIDNAGDAAADVAALSQADLQRLIGLLQDLIFRYKLDQRAHAEQILSDVSARDDAAFISFLRSALEKPGAVDVTFSVPSDQSGVKVNRKLKAEAFAFTFTPQNEAAVQALTALDDAAISQAFHAQDPDWLARIASGDLIVAPALDEAGLAQFEDHLTGDTFSITVQREANAHTASVTGVAWSPDGAWIASGSADKTGKVWDAATGQLIGTLEGHDDGLTDLAWSPDGAQIATSSWDGTVRLWSVAADGTIDDGESLKMPSGRATALTWSPDSSLLATGGRDGVIRLWDAASGDALAALEGHTAEVRALTWSPDGTTLVSSGQDNTARVWDVTAALAAQ